MCSLCSREAKATSESAAALNLSIGTVKGYVSAIFEKLGVEDRTQAALLAAKHDVTPPSTTR
jgi:DNA-binding NarL/FixJ family response regulator